MEGFNATDFVKQLGNKVKQFALNLSDLEIFVEEATNNDTWGPSSSQMLGEWVTLHTRA